MILFPGGLDDALNKIIQICTEQATPFVFALGRRALGRACAKLVPVSVVGIFNYEGTEVSSQVSSINQSIKFLQHQYLWHSQAQWHNSQMS